MLPLLLVAALTGQAPELIDRTLAIVAGRSIALSDARTVLALGLVEGTAVDRDLIQRLVDRELMLREAERYSTPEPNDADADTRFDAVRERAGGDEGLARVLATGGLTAERVRAWIRDDLRIDAYLQQRFAADDRREDLIADWVSGLRRRSAITILEP